MSQNRIGPELAPHTTFIMVIYILYLIGFSVIGVIMAYVKLGDVDGTLYGDHLRYLIKTFWIAFIGGIISVVLTAVVIGALILIAVGILFLVRSLYGLIKFANNEPVNPASWLI
ncbi:hypothetical protein [uncultured Cardiobacterium sp.]|uniref:DUF4870 family protein n=1 Tax=uncultured Cardiobacterium sp. TaxID=417619 RepID=UPI0026123E46|nr:hypothetical protein [uncultured Cardiobacterium sp.]